MQEKTIIVTGGAGFIGREFVNWALHEGHRVLCVDKLTYASDTPVVHNIIDRWKKGYPDTFTFLRKDINELEYLPDSDFLVHMAAETHVDNSIVSQSAFIRSNICGTEHILQLLKAKSVHNRPLLVALSTDEVYGDEPSATGHKEDAVLIPSSPYSASKAAADQLIMGYGRTFGIKWVIVRPSNNYGMGQTPEKLIPSNLRRLDRGEQMVVYGDGSNSRYWCLHTDTVRAIDKIMSSGITNQIFNISGDIILQNIEVLQSIASAYFKQPDMSREQLMQHCTFVDNRKGEDKLYRVDDSKLRKLTGWRPKHIDFDEEVHLIVEEYRGRIKNWI